MLKRAKSRGNKYRLICAKGIFPSQRTFPNSQLYITSRHFTEKPTTSILLPLEWGVWLFWRCSNSWNWYSLLSHGEKETGIRQSKFCRSESGPRCKVFALRALRRFLSNSICLWRFTPLKTLLVANTWSCLKKETMKKYCKGAIFKEILIKCTFCNLKYDSNTFCPDSQAE